MIESFWGWTPSLTTTMRWQQQSCVGSGMERGVGAWGGWRRGCAADQPVDVLHSETEHSQLLGPVAIPMQHAQLRVRELDERVHPAFIELDVHHSGWGSVEAGASRVHPSQQQRGPPTTDNRGGGGVQYQL